MQSIWDGRNIPVILGQQAVEIRSFVLVSFLSPTRQRQIMIHRELQSAEGKKLKIGSADFLTQEL